MRDVHQSSALDHTATHCNTLQHTATHCNTQKIKMRDVHQSSALDHTVTYCNTLQLTATHCNTIQLFATHCTTLQHATIPCNTLQHLQHTATHVKTCVSRSGVCCSGKYALQHTTTHCNRMQHIATHCKSLQLTATRCNTCEDIQTCDSRSDLRASRSAINSLCDRSAASFSCGMYIRKYVFICIHYVTALPRLSPVECICVYIYAYIHM